MNPVTLTRPSRILASFCIVVFALLLASPYVYAQGTPPAATTLKSPPAVGTIQSISVNALTLKTDAGAELNVQLSAETRVFRVPPGAKDLKEAVAIQLTDLQAGDRILVRGRTGDDAKSFIASAVIAMKKADIAEKRTKDREEWQRRGVGGLVKALDLPGGTILITTSSSGGTKDVVIHAGKNTVLRRYAPGSVNFDDAKLAPITEIRPGDQLRARGTRSSDGSEFSADEIVSGAFRNIAGTVQLVDPATGKLSVSDLATKKTVELKVTSDSQLRKLPQEVAQRIAFRLKGGAAQGNGANGAGRPGGQGPGGAQAQPGSGPPANRENNGSSGSTSGARGAGFNSGGGAGDVQQMLSRLPSSPLSDFQKGDVVMLVATSDADDNQPTVITLLGGVEPILQASTQATSILSPWSLSGAEGGEGGTP